MSTPQNPPPPEGCPPPPDGYPQPGLYPPQVPLQPTGPPPPRTKHTARNVLISVGMFVAVLLLIGVIGNAVNPAPVAAGIATPAPTVTVTATVTATVQAVSTAVPAPAATVTVTAKAEPAPTVTVTVTAKAEAQKEPEAPAESAISDGDYLVGSEVEPGTYKTTGNAEDQGGMALCYADTQSKSGDINAQEVTSKRKTLIRVKASDYTFSSSGCGDWKKVG